MFYPQANNIAAIHEDYNKTLWIGTYGGKLLQFNRESNTFVYWPYGLNMLTEVGTKYIMSFYEDRADSGSVLWIGTHSAGLAKLTWDDRGIGDIIHWQPEPGNPESINNFDVRCIHGDDFGRLWLGTAGGGLNIFGPKTEQFAHLVNEPGNLNSLSSNFVKCIYASANDSGRVLWIGTDAGLDKLVLDGTDIETVKFFHYKAKDGLPSEYICGILEDDNGYLWLSTIKGLSRFDPRTDTFRNYDIHDGLQGNEFTTGAALKSLSGEMFFGGINGFNSFYPDSIRDNPHFPPVVITDFQISNESVGISQQNQTPLRKHISETDEIVLSHRDNVFSFEFAALDYNTSEKNQYAYRMEGFDEDWIYSGTRRFATYTNLDPGEYVFRVKGSNNDGVWNEEGTSVRIIVTPPWWKTWWAYTLYVILIGALFYGYRRFELSKVRLVNDLKMQQLEANKLREIDHIKSRFFANISHEFRAPLTLILGPLKRLLSGDFQGDPKDQFRLMLRNGQRLLLLITQLLDLSKLEAGRMFLKARPENIVKVLINIVSQ
ncbi:MAG: triple tyrosine motif-containing protein, partial [Candidatus Zixiibacteriota bacterium]